MRRLISGGTVATALGVFQGDVLLENGRVIELGERLPAEGAQVLDAAGLIVMPGGVDVHTHVALDTGTARVADGFFHGTAAAAMGGTTCIVEHPGFGPQGCGLFHQIDAYLEAAEGRAMVDYALHGVLQRADTDVLKDIPRLAAGGVPTQKAYCTYAGRLDDAALLACLDALGRCNGLLTVHAENHAIISHLSVQFRAVAPADPMSHARSRPDYAEAEAVNRVCALARAAGAPVYIVHLSSALGLAAVRRARAEGGIVYAETCPQYLLLSQHQYAEPEQGGLRYVMAPPLRAPMDQDALWRGLADGSIDTVGTDHCAFTLADKMRLGAGNVFACPGGVPGVETRLPLLYTYGVATGRIGLPRFVELAATAPARIMGLTGKGALTPGADADIAVLDPADERRITAASLHQQAGYTPYEGLMARGWPCHVFVRNIPVVQNGQLVDDPGLGRPGRFVARGLEHP